MIEVNNLTTSPIDEKFLKGVAKKVLEGENKKRADLSIALVGEGRIKELNQKYRGKNKVTDVLSFAGKEIGLGEIVICLREVKKNAKILNSTFEKELVQVLIHGILHLLGYNHEKSKTGEKIMTDRQNYYLKKTI